LRNNGGKKLAATWSTPFYMYRTQQLVVPGYQAMMQANNNAAATTAHSP
jgi:hypothetical protein